MPTVNLLFLGGAKRVSMARHFKAAAAALGYECGIYSYEMSEREPIACEGTVIVGLRWSDADVLDDLRRVCRENNIGIIIPFVDGAVRVAALLAGEFSVPSCTPELADTMFDKVAAAEMFECLSLPVPATWHDGDPVDCLIAKPRRGSASKGIVAIDCADDLAAIADRGAYLIQRRIDRRTEYTCDCYVDTVTGDVLAVSPRVRLEVSGGEVTRSRTVADADVIALAGQTLAATGLRGAVTVQIMRDLDSGELMLMEINPRLGGGCVCSVAAGADIPGMILRQALGLPLSRASVTPGVEIARYPQEVVFYDR